MKRRNPLLAGLFNMLVPGSSYLYVDNDLRKFIMMFIGGGALIVVAYLLGTNIQNVRGYFLPVGLCPGVLILAVLGFLFYTGMTSAARRNNQTDSTDFYRSRRAALDQDEAKKAGTEPKK